jgi:hypothetical protein
MDAGDWINAAFLIAIGLLMGLVVDGLWGLVEGGAWRLAVVTALVGGAAVLLLFWFDGLVGRLLGQLFPGGVRPAPARSPRPRKPVALLVSLPAGLVLGIALARMGYTSAILGLS